MKTSTRNILLGVMLVGGFFAARYTIGLATQLRTHIDEEMVYAHYQKQINATRMFDARTLCAMLHPNFRGMDVVVMGGKEEKFPSNRDSNCDETRKVMDQMRAVYEATKQPPDLKYTIQSVTLSEDRRQASVRLKFEMTVAKVFTASGDTLETLTRERGKVYLLSSQSRGTVEEL